MTGTVADQRSGQCCVTKLAGATVRVLPFGVTVTSGSNGEFAFWIDVSSPCIKIDFEVSAPGFGLFRFRGAPIYPRGDLYFTLALLKVPHDDTYRAGGAAAEALATCHYPLPATSTH